MSETQTASVKEALRIVACLEESKNGDGRKYSSKDNCRDESWNGEYLEQLEKALAAEGQDELAREVRLRRNEIDEKRAVGILGSSNNAGATPGEMLKLAKRLAGNKGFGLARRVLKRARLKPRLNRTQHSKIYAEIFQKSALYTYKDPDLPVEWRLDSALEILGELEDLARTEDRETLGLAGAIHKRKWEVDGQRKHLGQSLSFYLRGYAVGLEGKHVKDDLAK